MALTVLIVDDSPQFLDASSSLLERGGLEVVGVAATTADALARAAQVRPDVVLVDIHLSGGSWFDWPESCARGCPRPSYGSS